MGKEQIIQHIKIIQYELNEIGTICLKLEARIDILEAQLEVLHEIMKQNKSRRKSDV